MERNSRVSVILLLLFFYIKRVLGKGQQKYIKKREKFRMSADPVRRTVHVGHESTNLASHKY